MRPVHPEQPARCDLCTYGTQTSSPPFRVVVQAVDNNMSCMGFMKSSVQCTALLHVFA